MRDILLLIIVGGLVGAFFLLYRLDQRIEALENRPAERILPRVEALERRVESLESRGFLPLRVEEKMARCTENSTFNLPCFLQLMKEDGFVYLPEREEKIKSVEEFLADRGGDCDDWAIFTREVLETVRRRGLEILVAQHSPGKNLLLLEEGGRRTYLRDASPLLVEGDPLVVCYEGNPGHCLVAMGKHVIEAQTGFCWEEENPLKEIAGHKVVFISTGGLNLRWNGTAWTGDFLINQTDH